MFPGFAFPVDTGTMDALRDLRDLRLAQLADVDWSDRATLISTGIVLWFTYLFGLGVYRLFFHPLSHIPGPRLAALTYWYEVYYEFKGPGGQFMFKCRDLHEQYGPIVRICPNEVVIQDSEFFLTMYAHAKTWDKPQNHKYRFNVPGAAQATPEHHIHKQRRAALNPFFSKRKIARLAPQLQQMMEHLCQRIDQEYRKTGRVLTLNLPLGCFSADAVSTICFDTTHNFIDRPDFRCSFVEAAEELANGVHVTSLFPAVGRTLYALPESVLAKMDPKIKLNIDFHNTVGEHIVEVFRSPRAKGEPETMFQTLRESDLPPEELTVGRLKHESGSIVGAGVHTVKWSLCVASYHIINSPHIAKRLREELVEAIPDINDFPPLEKLERLPYLSACIEEGLRLSYGVTQRLPRNSDSMSLQYGGYTIPPGTMIGMDIYSVHHDENIFPDSHTYIPERWLDSPKAPDGKPLSSYMLSFSRGTRSCVGIHFAYAELYTAAANLYRRFQFELYETDVSAVECHRDMFVPFPKPGTKGVRVLVK